MQYVKRLKTLTKLKTNKIMDNIELLLIFTLMNQFTMIIVLNRILKQLKNK